MKKRKVLFVCLGNSCRSQMAEGFAKAYGSDVMEAQSAGLSPATLVAPLTREVMGERNISLDDHFPKGLFEVELYSFDMIINISGYRFPERTPATLREWSVPDPVGGKKKVHERVADQLEDLVKQLVNELRSNSS